MDPELKEKMTAMLAAGFEAKLIEMGDDAKGISWFSSVAHKYPKNLHSTGTGDG